MVKIVSVEQMREIERATDAAGVSYDQMMQHAGSAVATVVKLLLGDEPSERRIAVLVGPGNNGGDGLVAARVLKEETGAEVGCYLLKPRTDDDPVFAAARDAGVFIANAEDDQRWRVLTNLVSNADMLIDALLGTGARLPIEGELKKLLEHTQQALHRDAESEPLIWPTVPVAQGQDRPTIIAVDCPSGLDSDTGELDPLTIHADITVTFAAAKLGQIIFPGADAVGELVVAGIGTPERLRELTDIQLELATGPDIASLLPERPSNSHKGTYGRAVVAAGSINYTGAAALAGAAAYRAGAGLVTMAVPQAIYPILSAQLPEATWLLLPHEMGVFNTAAAEVFRDEAGNFDVLLIGPGIGREKETAGFLRGVLQGQQQAKRGSIGFASRGALGETNAEAPALPTRVIIDADGLNLLSEMENWHTLLPDETVLTPHPGEMARLTGMEVSAITQDRVNIARQKAAEWGAVVVLKGAFTIVAEPGGRVVVNPFATDSLATAGTGDVLAGCIAGLMAQGISGFDAAVAGAYVHGLAGKLAGQVAGTRSVVAGDVLRSIPSAFELVEPHG